MRFASASESYISQSIHHLKRRCQQRLLSGKPQKYPLSRAYNGASPDSRNRLQGSGVKMQHGRRGTRRDATPSVLAFLSIIVIVSWGGSYDTMADPSIWRTDYGVRNSYR